MKKIQILLSSFLMIFFITATAHAEDLTWEELNAKVTGFYKQQQFSTAAGYGKEALNMARKSGTAEELATNEEVRSAYLAA